MEAARKGGPTPRALYARGASPAARGPAVVTGQIMPWGTHGCPVSLRGETGHPYAVGRSRRGVRARRAFPEPRDTRAPWRGPRTALRAPALPPPLRARAGAGVRSLGATSPGEVTHGGPGVQLPASAASTVAGEGRPLDHAGDGRVRAGVGTAADRAEAVQHRHADGGGEVAVAGSADRRLAQLDPRAAPRTRGRGRELRDLAVRSMTGRFQPPGTATPARGSTGRSPAAARRCAPAPRR